MAQLGTAPSRTHRGPVETGNTGCSVQSKLCSVLSIANCVENNVCSVVSKVCSVPENASVRTYRASVRTYGALVETIRRPYLAAIWMAIGSFFGRHCVSVHTANLNEPLIV